MHANANAVEDKDDKDDDNIEDNNDVDDDDHLEDKSSFTIETLCRWIRMQRASMYKRYIICL